MANQAKDSTVDWRSDRHPIEPEFCFGDGNASLLNTSRGSFEFGLGFTLGFDLVRQ
jgi:hypothetical protein